MSSDSSIPLILNAILNFILFMNLSLKVNKISLPATLILAIYMYTHIIMIM